MTRAAIVMLALVLVGCRPPAPPVAETRPELPEQPQPAQPVDVADVAEVAEVVETGARELVAVEHTSTTHVAPPGVGASMSACERSCGEVHDCALLERSYTPAAAAAIELGCVRACLGTPERATLFGCGRPSAIEPGTCAQFLVCVDTAWPQAGDGELGIETPATSLGIDPCVRGCDAFARCWDAGTKPELIEQCAELCREQLDDEGERKFGSCAELPECADIMICVAETPNATSSPW